jgi:hypothetical protein
VYYRQFGCIWDDRDALVRRLRTMTRHEIATDVPQLSIQARRSATARVESDRLTET